MKKNLNVISRSTLVCIAFTCILSLTSFNASCQSVKTSIANGDWFNPAIWSPAGVPIPTAASDTVIINSQVTFNQTLDARGVAHGAFIIKSGASLSGISANDTLVLGVVNYLINYGTISANSSIAIGDIFISTLNYGQITSGILAESGDFYNYSHINANKVAQSGNFNNEAGAIINATNLMTSSTCTNKLGSIIVLTDSLITTGLVTNNGDISALIWFNGENVAGTTGKFCIATCIINGGNIAGTVDICDATPSGFCDVNVGTIAATVTYCTSGPCATSVSVNEFLNDHLPEIFPNPSNGIFTIDYIMKSGEITIYNLTGEIVLSKEVISKITEIDLSGQPAGIYFVKLQDGQVIQTEKIVVQ